MRKVVVFLLVTVLALGAVGYASAELFKLEDDVVYSQNVLFGDPACLEGHTAGIRYRSGSQHLTWYTDFNFGTEPSSQTRFALLQKQPQSEWFYPVNHFDIRCFHGLGYTVSGGTLELTNTPLGKLVQSVALMTPDGETFAMSVKPSDYIDSYPLEFDIDFRAPGVSCFLISHFGGALSDSGDPAEYEAYTSSLNSLFHFPVLDDCVFQVEVSKDPEGNPYSLNIDSVNTPECGLISTANETGCYLIPYYQDPDGNPVEVGTPDGMGLYYLPWKELSEYTYQDDATGEERTGHDVLPNPDGARNICPMDTSTIPIDLKLSEDKQTGWLLCREESEYVLFVIDLTHAELLNRIPLTPVPQDSEATMLHATYSGNLLVAASDDRLTLVNLDGIGSVEFSTDAGEGRDYLSLITLSDSTVTVSYDGEQLVLLCPSYNRDCSFWAAVYTENGLHFLGEYQTNLQELDYAVSNHFEPISFS